jgi:transcriptional regulator with XRE-family HTH domain
MKKTPQQIRAAAESRCAEYLDNIRVFIAKHGVEQTKIAEYMGVSQNYVSLLIGGQKIATKSPGIVSLLRLLEALEQITGVEFETPKFGYTKPKSNAKRIKMPPL